MNAKELVTKEFLQIDENEVLSRLIGKLVADKQEAVLVFGGEKFSGLFDKKKLIKSKIDITSTKMKNFVKKVSILKPEQEDKEIAKLISSSDVRVLPVFEGKKLLGVVQAIDLLDGIKDQYSKVKITRLMKKVISFNADDPISKALELMHDKKIDRAPVIDKDSRFIGVISLMDLITRYHSFPRQGIRLLGWMSHQTGGRHKGAGMGEKQHMTKLPVKDILSPRNMITCPEDHDVKCAIEEMVANNVHSIIIVRKSQPVGIITVKDILMDYAK